MFKIRNIFLVLLACCSIFLFASCGSTQQSNSANVLKMLYWQAPTILNPHLSAGYKDAEASRITLEPLASYDAKGVLIPFLAAEIPSKQRGTVSADGKSVTWRLKKGIKWSDGQLFSAKDVLFTYEFIKNPQSGSSSLNYYQGIEKVEAIDNYTVKVTFTNPNPAWSNSFVGPEGMILPQHIYANYVGKKAHQAPANIMPIGTGPYRVVQFKPGDLVIYQANPYYRDFKKLAFSRIELKGGGDPASAARAVMQTHEADFAYNLQVENSLLQDITSSGKGQLIVTPGPLVERVLLNQSDPNHSTDEGEKSSLKFKHPFLSDPKVRKAIALAIDRQTIAKQLYGITGQPTNNFLVAPSEFVSKNNPLEYNPTKAKQLLEQAGWHDSNGDGIRERKGQKMQMIFQSSANSLRQKSQEIIKANLGSIGIGVELKSIDASVFFSSDPSNSDTVEHFYADMQMFTMGNSSPQPNAYFKTYTCGNIPQKANNWSGENYSRYCNNQYDQLWQKASQELQIEKRKELFIALNDMLIQNNILVPLVRRADVVAISPRLSGVEISPWERDTWKIANWKLNKK